MKAIVAMTPGGVIGVDGRLPWHIPADLAHFKALTTGGTVVMGRSTFESIGRPLPGRHNVVLTRNPAYAAPGCEVLTDLNEVYRRYPDAWVIGGAEVYAALMPWTSELHMTVVKAPEPQEGTLTRFPSLRGAWLSAGGRLHPAGPGTPYDLVFHTYRRL